MFEKSKLIRYTQLANLFIKYGRSDFVEAISKDLGTKLETLDSAIDGGRGPQDFVDDLVELGPTFVKLGQMLSTRADLLTQPYLDALASLQDDVPAIDFEEIERVLSIEMGVRPSKVFARLNPEPLAAASLGQVHRATLRDGREVVVKIQRPGIREQIVEDLEILDDIAQGVDRHTEIGRQYEFSRLVDQFRAALLGELDYQLEANNLAVMREELSDFRQLLVPQPITDLTTSKVLVMEMIHGESVASIGPLRRIESNFDSFAKILCEAYLHQILVAGFFHADPHPGNILVTDENKVALIDLGMVAHIEAELRGRLMRVLLALCEGRGRETAELALELGEKRENANVSAFIDQVSDLVTKRQNQIGNDRKLGQTLLTMVSIFAVNGVRPPVEVSLVGKTLLLLDEVAETLEPDFDPDTVIDGFAQELMKQQLAASLDPKNAMGKLLDAQVFAERLPRRLNTVLDALSDGELKLKVDALDEANLITALERIGNRIAMGLVLAALIVGAALMMEVETRWTFLGYPALAIILFLIAAILGFGMVIGIVAADRKTKKHDS